MKIVELNPVYTETLTPREFLSIYERERHDFKAVRVVPPVLGKPGFGHIVVERRLPVHRASRKGARLPVR